MLGKVFGDRMWDSSFCCPLGVLKPCLYLCSTCIFVNNQLLQNTKNFSGLFPKKQTSASAAPLELSIAWKRGESVTPSHQRLSLQQGLWMTFFLSCCDHHPKYRLHRDIPCMEMISHKWWLCINMAQSFTFCSEAPTWHMNGLPGCYL